MGRDYKMLRPWAPGCRKAHTSVGTGYLGLKKAGSIALQGALGSLRAPSSGFPVLRYWSSSELGPSSPLSFIKQMKRGDKGTPTSNLPPPEWKAYSGLATHGSSGS